MSTSSRWPNLETALPVKRRRRLRSPTFEPATEFKPGQKAKVKIKLTDYSGKPFVGSTVVAIYDKSVEYISGGSNVPEIKEFFWKWQRAPQSGHRVEPGRFFGNIVPPKRCRMDDLGVFGGSVAEDPNAPAANDGDADGQGGPWPPAAGLAAA